MSKGAAAALPPSGISVWRPLPSSQGSLVAIVGSGPAGSEDVSGEDVQCVWCGLRSRPAAACEVCGSPLYESISIWQPGSMNEVELPGSTTEVELPRPNTKVEPPPGAVQTPAPPVIAPGAAIRPQPNRFGWPARANQAAPPEVLPQPAPDEPAREPTHRPAGPPPDTTFKAFRRFAGLDIRWVRRRDD